MLVPSPALTAPVTVPPLIVNVSSPLLEVTEPTDPAPLFITRVLLVPSPRSRLPLNEPPLCTVTPSTPVERLRFSMALKEKLPVEALSRMVPVLAPVTVTTSSVAVVLPRRMSVPVAPTRLSMLLKLSVPCPVLPPA